VCATTGNGIKEHENGPMLFNGATEYTIVNQDGISLLKVSVNLDVVSVASWKTHSLCGKHHYEHLEVKKRLLD
jgi:hypothetical protein